MKKIILFLIPILIYCVFITACSKSTSQNSINKTKQGENKSLNKNIYDLTVKTMEGESKNLSDYNGKVLLIVNVASKCGNTPQYEGLEKIYEKYKDKNFEILAFPCNDFGGQEPGTNDEIKTFCTTNYNVSFPLFDKIKVLGDEKSALYERLVSSDSEGDVKWNFEKFLIDKKGDIVSRFRSKVKPESEEIVSAIETELNK